MAHSPETKAAAVADLLRGDSYNAVAKRYGVSKGIVVKWANAVKSDQLLTAGDRSITEEARDVRFITALERMAVSMTESIVAVLDVVSSEEYLREKNPADVAELLGKTQEWGFRILEATRDARERVEGSHDPELP